MKRFIKWIERNKIVYICRYSNGLSRKCERIFKITSRAKEQLWWAAGYEANIQKSVAFLSTSNEKLKLKKYHLQKYKKVKNLGTNLTACIQNLYVKNCKTLLKEIKDEVNEWIDIHVHGLEDSI